MKTTSIAGFPGASIASRPPRLRPCNTQVLLITLRDSPTCIPMVLFPTVGLMDTAGDHSESDSAGHPSRTGNGLWIPLLAGPGPAISRGAGRPTTTEGGSSTPPAASGVFFRPAFTQDLGIPSVRRRGYPRR